MLSIQSEVDELGPWITGFNFRGERYGGDYVPEKDSRLSGFVTSFRAYSDSLKREESRLRILECGCLEGGHTIVLAQAFPDAEIIATDFREANLRKARFLANLHDLKNIRWLQENLANPQHVWQENYDAIFCVGLLYHLHDPRRFLSEAADHTRYLWLWTVICAETDATITEGKFRGRMLTEKTDHPLSGVEPESFLPTLGSLADMLWDSGFRSLQLLQKELTLNNNGPCVLLEAKCQPSI